MDNFSSLSDFEKYLSTSALNLNIFDTVLNLILAGLLSLILVHTYMICATSISNRKNLSKNFLILTITTVFIITIVKSSLALSLGLVGALSIIRFRTAIKEPEELLYLFVCISIGLGLGANQKIITILSFGFILIFIWGRYYFVRETVEASENLVLSISYDKNQNIDSNLVIDTIKKNSTFIKMIRLDENNTMYEATFNIEFENYHQLNSLREILNKNFEKINLTIVDNSSLI